MLTVVPIKITDAKRWISKHHSHLEAPVGALCAVGVAHNGQLCCVATLSRPVSRRLQSDPACAEVNRVASDGSAEHAASKVLGAISRAAFGLGYRRLVSYTLIGEAGTSYRAAGWWPTAVSKGGNWSCNERPWGPRDAVQPGAKVRWEYGPDANAKDSDVDELVRNSVGKVLFRQRSESLPLFARIAS